MDKLDINLYKLLLVFACCIGFYFVMSYSFIYVYPFFIAINLAFFLHPFITFLEKKWHLHRTLAVFLVLGSFITLLCLFSFFILKKVITEAIDLTQKIPTYSKEINIIFEGLLDAISPYLQKINHIIPFEIDTIDTTDTYIHLLLDKLSASSLSIFQFIVTSGTAIFSSFAYIVTICMFILLFVFIMTKDMHHIIAYLHTIIPKRFFLKCQTIIIELRKTVIGFIKAQIILTLLTTICSFIGFFIFNIDHLFTMTLLIFIVDFFPYIGVGVVFIPWIIVLFLGHQYDVTIQLSILYMFIIVVRQLLEPKIIAANIGVHPLIALSILFISLHAFGLLGLLVSPVILILYSVFYHARVFHFIWSLIRN